jgi:hypothetical protein
VSGDEDDAMATEDGATPMASEPMARQAFELTVEWALWGRRVPETEDHVLQCSRGTFTPADFQSIIARYTTGMPDRLPQYSVGWVPGEDRAPAFVAVVIQEQIPHDSGQHGCGGGYEGLGGELVVRLFCVRYADLAAHVVSYAELLDAVQQQEFPPWAVFPGPVGPAAPVAPATAGPVAIRFPPLPLPLPPPRPVADFAPELAKSVAALLLDLSQVCVLGAYEVPAADRLVFIDSVMSLLPYGMRASMSASTWASSTVQDLKLRLFFANTRRDDSKTWHVRWGQPDPAEFPDPDGEAARLYFDWLRLSWPSARSWLASQAAPARFIDADIRQMVAALPRDLTVADTLEDLAASLNDGDAISARAELQRLEDYLDDPIDPTDRDTYRRKIADLGLFGDHQGLPDSTNARIYRVLLRLAFEMPLSYDNYCMIEDAIGGPPHEMLRSALLKFNFATFLPWLLSARAGADLSDEMLAGKLGKQDVQATAPLNVLQRDLENIRPAHRAAMYDFAVLYLRSQAEDARTELVKRGYLADTLEAVFPADRRAQITRLVETLRFIHDMPLDRGKIRELFRDPDLRPTAAFEAAVTRLASSLPNAAKFVAEQAAYSRLRYRADGEESQRARHSRWRLRPRQHREDPPGDLERRQDPLR